MQRESAERDEIISIILQPTAMQTLALDRARAQSVEQHGYSPYRHYCPHKTNIHCIRSSPHPKPTYATEFILNPSYVRIQMFPSEIVHI